MITAAQKFQRHGCPSKEGKGKGQERERIGGEKRSEAGVEEEGEIQTDSERFSVCVRERERFRE